jgi:hypothetical protein
MKPESEAWMRLQDFAAKKITPGFPERVLRAAREHASPLFVAQFAMCAATAALCLGAVILFNARSTAADDATSLAGWSEIATQANELEQGL